MLTTLTFALLAALGQVAPESQCHSLKQQLRSADRDERHLAAVALGDLGPQGACAIDGLRDALHDPDWLDVGLPAFQALGRIGPPAIEAFPDIVAHFGDPQTSAADMQEALVGLGPGVIRRLIPYLDAGRVDGEVPDGPNALAARVLASFGERAVPALVDALKQPRSRFAAADALGRMGAHAGAAVSTLVAAFGAAGNDEWDQGVIAWALASIGKPACSARQTLDQAVVRSRRAHGNQATLTLGLDESLKTLTRACSAAR